MNIYIYIWRKFQPIASALDELVCLRLVGTNIRLRKTYSLPMMKKMLMIKYHCF